MADKREYVKLDIGYLSNPKVAALLLARRPLAVLLHIECITYSRQHRTDGVVPTALALRGVIGATKRDVTACLDAGLLVDRGDGTVQVHDYLEHQESAKQIDARSAAAQKANRVRWSRAQSGPDRSPASGSQSEPDSDSDPVRNPEERRGEKKRTTTRPAEPDTFDAWWAAYPRKEGKGRAKPAYAKAVRDVPADKLLRLTAEWFEARPDLEPQFVPLPASWLNARRWEDERPPTRPQDRPRPGASVWDRPVTREDHP